MIPAAAVLLKAPRPGLVKTRLAAGIGERRALRLYRLMAERTLEAVAQAGWEATVWFTPAEAGGEMADWLGPRWGYQFQPAGDLGTRLAAAARDTEGEAVVLLGGDCPGLTADDLRAAALAIAEGRVAVGPCPDGGYYLLGSRRPFPPLFKGMPWSGPGLLDATRQRLRSLGVRWQELRELRDVDTRDDAEAEGLLT